MMDDLIKALFSLLIIDGVYLILKAIDERRR